MIMMMLTIRRIISMMMMMMMMMGIRMMPVVICLPQRLIHALVLQPPFPCASPLRRRGRRIYTCKFVCVYIHINIYIFSIHMYINIYVHIYPCIHSQRALRNRCDLARTVRTCTLHLPFGDAFGENFLHLLGCTPAEINLCSVHMPMILWMDEILHHPRNHGKPRFVGISRGIIIPGFLWWCGVHMEAMGLAIRPESCPWSLYPSLLRGSPCFRDNRLGYRVVLLSTPSLVEI